MKEGERMNNKFNRMNELMEDIKKLTQIKNIYESTSDFLSGGFYNDFMSEINEQITELRKAIENLSK
jgi:hypothetical protein